MNLNKIFLFAIFLLISINLLADYPIMLKVQSKVSIPDDFRDGIEEGLTIRGYSLVDEKAQQEALKSQKEQRESECYDDACLVDTGKMLAARALIIVEVKKKEEKSFKFKIRFVDFEKGTTTKTKVKYYKESLSNYESLSLFGKKVISDLFIDHVKENKESSKRKIKKKELKKWGFNFAVSGGDITGDILLIEGYSLDKNNIDSKMDFHYFEGEISGKGMNVSLGSTYKFNNWFNIFVDFSLFKEKGDTIFIRENEKDRDEHMYKIKTSTFKIDLGVQFTFGDTFKYYFKIGLGTGNTSLGTSNPIRFLICKERNADGYCTEKGEEIEEVMYSNDSFSLFSLLVELGFNFNLFRENFDLFLSLNGMIYLDSANSTMYNDPINSSNSATMGMVGLRYNFLNF